MNEGFNQQSELLKEYLADRRTEHETFSPDQPRAPKSLILLASILAASPQPRVQQEFRGKLVAALLVCILLPVQHGMRVVKAAMLLYDVFSGPRFCTTPSYPHCSGWCYAPYGDQ